MPRTFRTRLGSYSAAVALLLAFALVTAAPAAGVQYAGNQPQSRQRVWWQVRVRARRCS
jgi:hypothetical protein